jgi:Trypsin-like peptidase domain/Calcineurin-like phosphoesterase
MQRLRTPPWTAHLVAERSPDRFIVSLIGPRGTAVGVGVLVGAREIMTCAHVVNEALGLDQRSQIQPTGRVMLRFPLIESHASANVPAEVQVWVPPPREGAAGDDLAGLVLTDEAPVDAEPARLAVNPPAVGLRVRVFGYAGTPPRPEGAWVSTTVQGKVAGGRLQLESGVDAALRAQPGYSGSPVYDETSGLVVGLVAAAAPGRGGERDSYAIATDRLRLAWPRVVDPRSARSRRHRPSSDAPAADGSQLTLLHVSDSQFGRNHIFGGNGLTPADQARDTLHARLHEDLARLSNEDGLHPDLIVVTGDLAELGLRSELDQAFAFVAALAEAVELPRHRVAIVPGNHDVNRRACLGYFAAQEADEREPVPPYFPKWTQFAAGFEAFYADVGGASFTPDEPWTLFEMPDLSVVVAGLNSTMAESHRDDDHHGYVGEHQLRWFADRLAGYRSRGWLRLAAVHHNVVRGAVLDDENLCDADDLDRILGEPRLVNLLLHGPGSTGTNSH